MKILILGAGQVGSTVAHVFSKEAQNEITIIDSHYEPLAALKEQYDIRTIRGNAAHPTVLEEADAASADIIIAVTSSDEVNIVACQLAYSLFNVKLKIARLRSQAYIEHSDNIFGYKINSAFNIDVVISPEILVTDQIKNIIELPGAHDVLRFAKGKALMISTDIQEGAPFAYRSIAEIREKLPHINVNFTVLFRDGEEFFPNGETVLLPGDYLYFLTARHQARHLIEKLNPTNKTAKKIIIAGGGNIGAQLAETLETFAQVKVIETDSDRAHRLSSNLNNSLVLQGDCTDENLLFEENIETTDIFCAVTNDDQTNILSSMLAKRLGAKYAMTLINRSSFLELIQEESKIDLAFSPQQVTLSTLLTYIRKGDVVQVYSLGLGSAEAIEIVAHGTEESSKLIGKHICDIKWPEGTILSGIIRKGNVLIINDETLIEDDDHIILYINNKDSIPEIEELFKINN
ncbi:Trk system potassium transporter TrkA [Ignatzschineria sp. RMDPL8A]|uniref:Trk system potassium transporter TrkA n=1 Tax=Ignatzschineria sp. RMDPL8A TaxID=2999236 RepID=UPI0016BB4A1B|nr:Trk system potassium transporter TrkA [Ignatzschineria sp. RMDPL8A]MDG9730108.1 Trk system potassium transporter TrkA [Ignatzschineria sp. RMDPL8A]NLD10087.1 Trk system potassium transporter TrkA [Xanthomonadaceae bacterium]